MCVCVCVCVCNVSYTACKAHALYNIVICGPSSFIVFFHVHSQKVRMSENLIEPKMCVLIFYTKFA